MVYSHKCPHCGIDKFYKTKKSFEQNKNRLCRRCGPSLSKGGKGFAPIIDNLQTCTRCSEKKEKEDFGNGSACKQCRNSYYKDVSKYQRYSISKLEFENLLIKQNNSCAICNKDAQLVIDHSHITNKVRGLLCHECNVAIGFFKENIKSLNNAIKYLTEKE